MMMRKHSGLMRTYKGQEIIDIMTEAKDEAMKALQVLKVAIADKDEEDADFMMAEVDSIIFDGIEEHESLMEFVQPDEEYELGYHEALSHGLLRNWGKFYELRLKNAMDALEMEKKFQSTYNKASMRKMSYGLAKALPAKLGV